MLFRSDPCEPERLGAVCGSAIGAVSAADARIMSLLSHPRTSLLLKGLVLLLAAGVVAAAPASSNPVASPVAPTTSESVDIRRDATVAAIEKVMPAVVNISTKVRSSRLDDPIEKWLSEFFGHRQRSTLKEYSRGSGVVIDPEGYVLTNVHVVQDVDDIRVQFADTGETLPAERVALSASKDVALLRIRSGQGRRFKSVKLAREDDLLLGETVMALGNPFGLGGSVSRGILSSKSRRAPGTTTETTRLDIEDWLQTDASINPGNSGGPLVNLKGELIGLSVAVLPAHVGAQGIGFAIPIRRVNEALAETLSGDSVSGWWFGARLQPGRRPLAIRSVQPGSPAEAAGLKAGDVIVEVVGRPVDHVIEFNRRLLAGVGRDVSMGLKRGTSAWNATVRLVKESEYFDARLVRRRLGILLEASSSGLVVKAVDADGPAAGRLAAGMLIEGMDGQVHGDLLGVAKAIHAKKQGERAELMVAAYRRTGPFLRREEGIVNIAVR